MPNWYRVDKDDVRFYRAWNIHSSGMVRHGFSTRIGGVSDPPYNTLNLGLTVNDNSRNVLINRKKYADSLEIDAAKIVVPNQVHRCNVRQVMESDAGSGAIDQSNSFSETDALITNIPNITLALHFADCVCIFLLDPINRAIGVVHAGWSGTAGKIVKNTIDAMNKAFNTNPQDILAAISPSIGRCCYEVGTDVARQIYKAFPHEERVISQFSIDKWRVDLKVANFISLQESGVLPENIAISEHCTSCDANEFFSYRRDCETGRMGGWMCLV